jgi:RHS repeat-associated protein
MGAVTEVAEVYPDTKDLPSKNRVWGFRTPARHRIRKSVSQAAESRRENAPTPTNIASGISQFLLTDQVGTLRVVADSTGTIVKRIDYDSFGNIIADSNPAFTVPFGFAGGLHDRDTGLVRFGARDYDPNIGRWTAKDPLDFAGGDTNLYAYVMNDPVNFTDPEGLTTNKPMYDPGSGGSDFCESNMANRKFCGSGPTENIINDFPAGFDFRDSCKVHDNCYATRGARRWVCDVTLPLIAITGECSKYSGFKKAQCMEYAWLFWAGVSLGGDIPYYETQKGLK